MAVTLDPATEERIQRKIDEGNFRGPDEVIARALDLLDDDQSWSPDDKADLDRHLSASLAAAERGELYTPEQARSLLTERRALRHGQRHG